MNTSELNYIEFFREINFTNKLFKLHCLFFFQNLTIQTLD